MEKYNNLKKELDYKLTAKDSEYNLMLKDKDIELLNLKLQLLQK
jgi:hypothetical protein